MLNVTHVPITWGPKQVDFRRPSRGAMKGKNTVEVTLVGILPDDFKQGGYEKLMGFLANVDVCAHQALNKHLPTVAKET